MDNMKVKVCGITHYEDAALALDYGVDALGFNFYKPSPRYVDPADARAIIRRLPPFSISVGLFVNAAMNDVKEIAYYSGVQAIQLHGDETPAYCRELENWPLLKAIRIGGTSIPDNLQEFPVRAFLLDAKDDALFGGTGKSFDWRLAKNIPYPIVLAGGLRPENIRDAIRIAAPYGVDVCSGVESKPGKKDAQLLAEFMNEVRHVRSDQ
jgi:phosphoribosylanthranilate isomerase